MACTHIIMSVSEEERDEIERMRKEKKERQVKEWQPKRADEFTPAEKIVYFDTLLAMAHAHFLR